MAGAESQHVAVIGAGPWGLAAAWAAGAQGARVTILDDGRPPTGAVAAGMIAPWSETEDDDQPLHATLRRAAEAWPSFASRLAAAGGDPGYEPIGSLAVAARPEHLGVVRRLRDALERVGRSEPWQTGSALRLLEPGLAGAVSGGLSLPGEGHVDPLLALPALRAAARSHGAEVERAAVERLLRAADGRVTGCLTADGRLLEADLVVLAAGAAAVALDPRVPLRPVKGQILTLGPRGRLGRPLVHMVRTPDVYLVPRPDGRVVVGATSEELADRDVTAEGVHRLLDEALHTVPDLGDLALLGVEAGLRPATRDGLPVLGRRTDDGLVWLGGGYRHGYLLLPLIGEVVEAALGARPTPDLARFSPDRFDPTTAEDAGARAAERRPTRAR